MEEPCQWRILESRGIGRGKIHNLTTRGLSIGRTPKADIVVLSMTVDEHHATVEWDELNECFLIRDLNSVNGTFLNQQPLRDTSHVLQNGDSLRFGYDKDQVFRVDVVKLKSSEPVTQSSNTGTQTSREISSIPSSSHSIIPVQYIVSQSPQTILIPSSSTGQYTLQQLVPTVTMTPSTIAFTTIPQIITHQSTSTVSNSGNNVSMVTASTKQEIWSQSKDHQTNIKSKEALRIRIDGRKSVPLTFSPVRAQGSPLYGYPSWWGEDEENIERENRKEMLHSDSELIPRKPGSQILRDFEPNLESTFKTPGVHKYPTGHQHLTPTSRNISYSLENLPLHVSQEEHEGKKRAQSEERDTVSFTVEFEGPKRTKPPNFKSKRPLSFAGRLSDLENLQRSSSPVKEKSVSHLSSTKTSGKSINPKKSKIVQRDLKKPSRKPPSGVQCKDNRTKVYSPAGTERTNSKKDETFIISGGELDSSSNVVVSPQISNTPLESKSEMYLPKKAHSQPGSLQGTPFSSSESGSRPASARKQWINEEVPHGLIMASIEARMKRLAQSATDTSKNIEHMIAFAKTKGVHFDSQMSLGTLLHDPSKSSLPLWKIMNQDYENISRYISEVEKSLRDMNVAFGTREEVNEEVDYNEEEDESDCDRELFIDSLDDVEGEEEEEEEEDKIEVHVHQDLEQSGDESDDLYFSVSSEPDDD